MPERTALYRLYSADGTLIYVGISKNPEQRWGTHKSEKPWWQQVARKTVEWFDDRVTAAKAEATAVRVENPLMNQALPDEDGGSGYSLRFPRPKREPGESSKLRRIRLDDDLWERLDAAARTMDPDSNRSIMIRRFARWYVGDIGEMPQRPEPRPARSQE